MDTLSGVWRHRVSAGTGWPGVTVTMRDRELDLQLLSLSLSVAARNSFSSAFPAMLDLQSGE